MDGALIIANLSMIGLVVTLAGRAYQHWFPWKQVYDGSAAGKVASQLESNTIQGRRGASSEASPVSLTYTGTTTLRLR